MSSTTGRSSKREERAQDRAVERTIEETKDTTRKAIQEVKREIPEFTAAFHDYQEENINTIKEMATGFLESQKEVARLMRSTGSIGQSPWSYWNNANPMNAALWPYMYWGAPQETIEAYARMVNQIAEGTIAATRLSNEMIISSMESTKATLRHAQNNSKAISKYMVDTASELNRSAAQQRR
jgi:uridine kinase